MFNRLSWLPLGVLAALALFLMGGLAQAATATTYYVDQTISKDSYNGHSATVSRYDANVGPWQSLSDANQAKLHAGDTVRFKRGSVFYNGLAITTSGTSDKYGAITFTWYGSSGDLPVFKKGNNQYDYLDAITVSGQYIVLDGLSAQAAHYVGIFLANTANYVTVRNCYITNVGIGIFLDSSSNNLITNNKVVSLHMVRNTKQYFDNNTQQIVNNNDDFGATGIWLDSNSSNNRITNNILSKCAASSFDYGYDGGALEIYLKVPYNVCDNNLFSGNRVDAGVGVVEIGADSNVRQTGKVSNLTLSNNICYKNGTFSVFHYDEGLLTYENVVVANNTIVEPYDFIGSSLSPPTRYPVIGYDSGFADYRTTIWYNNIFYVGYSFLNLATNFVATHYNNDYFLENSSTQYGLIPNTNGNITSNPLFVTYDPTKDFEYQNFHLQPGSPAAGKGAYVPGGYNLN